MKAFPARLWGWMLERYPPFLLLLHSMVYCSSIWIASTIQGFANPFVLSRDLWGCLSLFLFPMVLRIMDEHKDYEQDLRLYPNRPVQRGLITLRELRVVAYFSCIIQLGFCLWADQGLGDCTLLWLITMLYALLMAKEFFCGEWLEKRMVLYAISHQAITPISMLWVTAAYSSQEPIPLQIWGLILIGLFGSFGYELSRKLKAPDDERPEIASYTQSIGAKAAPFLTGLLLACQGGFTLWWLGQISLSTITLGGEGELANAMTKTLAPTGAMYFIHIVLTFLCVLPFLIFLGKPTTKGAKLLEGMSALMTLWTYFLLLYVCWIF